MRTDKWQAIETAPKDRAVLLTDGEAMAVCSWSKADNDFAMLRYRYFIRDDWGDAYVFDGATHWRPLPEAPDANG